MNRKRKKWKALKINCRRYNTNEERKLELKVVLAYIYHKIAVHYENEKIQQT